MILCENLWAASGVKIQNPIQDLPIQDLPVQDLLVQDLPIQDLPIQHIPIRDIAIQDIPPPAFKRLYNLGNDRA
jgi:hypothetical protein